MTHVSFNPDTVNWAPILALQQQQEGRGEMQYFVGTRYQRGAGLLKNVARFLMPVASNVLKAVSREGVTAGSRIMEDLSQGKAFKESIQAHAKQGIDNLAEKLKQCGKGAPTKKRHMKKIKVPKNVLIPSLRAINKTNVRELLPLSALNQTGPYLFRLFSDSQYCDLSKTYMYLLSSIERKNGAGEWVPISDAEPEDKRVGVIQNFGSSFVRSLKINISGIEMRDDGQDSVTNEGFIARAARFSNGKHCETMVRLNFDLAHQSALMLNNQDLVFTIHRNNDSFLMLTPPWKKADGSLQENSKEYRIRVHDLRLYVRTVDVTPSLNLAINRQLESTSAKYPLRKIEMRSIFLGKGRTELAHNVFTSTLPRRLICCFVSTDAYSGNRKLSPFKFEHANVRAISAEANGQSFPSTPYLLSFDDTQQRFMRVFVDMYAGLGLDDSDSKTVSIGMQRFLSGWTFFVIPMTSTLDDTPGFELIRQGTCTLKVQFEKPIKDDGYEMLILGEFDSILSINADRVLSTDGSV
ncbi:hypothetical protein niasHS_004160 [Heterodera schachtii]|uniref:Uncharacterized protein n=1 Tax=Heterodera schachtii TaxID=97005 RepID=A0ABD2JZZ6_HETSC